MKVSMRWLKDYVDIKLTSQELAHKLTMAGLEVDNITHLGEGINGVVVGQILEVHPHPQADRLVVCSVKISPTGEPQTIVTGAKNVKPGMKVPVATVGSTLPNGIKIDKAVFRGVASYGMLCSAEELGLDDFQLPEEEKNGIMSLAADAPVGAPIQEVLGLDDEVLELDLTPNRADCLSLINIAREVAAITGATLKLPEIKECGKNQDIKELVSVNIIDEDLCGRYIARIVKNVKVGPSPDWLKHRLQAAGMRSINNVVDITNFVMLETGQPLHAFDYDKLAGHEINVRKAREGEKIVTLDGNERKLDGEMLVICDAENPVAIAGVMGGLDSEVTESTTTILLESAHFNGVSVRRTSRKLGLRSEASSRFEKGVNIEGAMTAVNRAVDLIEQLQAGNAVSGAVDVYPRKLENPEITLRVQRVNDILGTQIGKEEIVQYLQRLNFEVKSQGELLKVKVPSYRGDVSREIDLIEEVARIYGYDSIPTTMPQGTMAQSKRLPLDILEDKCKEILISCGMSEIISYSFIHPHALDKIRLAQEDPRLNVIRIQNPLTEDQSIMRTSLLPGLLEVAARNFNRQQTNLSLFECGRVFWPQPGNQLPQEEKLLAGLVSGEIPKSWNWPSEEMDFYYLKGIIEKLFEELNNKEIVFRPTSEYPTFHPGRTAQILLGDKPIGIMGELHPLVLENYDISQRAWAFEIEMAPLLAGFNKVKTYKSLPKYPAVQRDMALLMPEKVSAQEALEAIIAAGGDYLEQCRLFDVYRGQQIPEGYKSMAFSLVYQAHNATLTDSQILEIHQRIEQELQKRFGAQVR